MKLSKEEFFAKIRTIEEATSVNGICYSDICVSGKFITGTRNSTGNDFRIDAEELYKAYLNCDRINTNILKDYITGQVQSPAYAILIAADLA